MNSKLKNRQHGVMLVEFLLVAFSLTTLVFMGVQFGLLMSRLQVTGEGARIAARDAATKPGNLTLPVSSSPIYIDSAVFNENFTVIDLGNLRFPSGAALTDQDGDSDVDLDDQFRVLPSVHSLLRNQMVLDTTSFPGRSLLRLRGVLLRNAAAPFDLIVRVPDISGSNAVLRRAINPPLSLTAEGSVRMECRQWFDFSSWFLGGAAIPDPLIYSNLPAGYLVVSIDLEAGSRHGMALGAFAVGRKEIQ
jgi:hypothetical protein